MKTFAEYYIETQLGTTDKETHQAMKEREEMDVDDLITKKLQVLNDNQLKEIAFKENIPSGIISSIKTKLSEDELSDRIIKIAQGMTSN